MHSPHDSLFVPSLLFNNGETWFTVVLDGCKLDLNIISKPIWDESFYVVSSLCFFVWSIAWKEERTNVIDVVHLEENGLGGTESDAINSK